MKKLHWLALLLLVALLFSVGVAPAAAQSVEKVRVLISFTQPPGQAERALVRGAGGEIGHTFNHIPTIAARVPETAISGLLRNPRITHIEADGIAYAIEDTLPWGVDRIDAEVVHKAGNKGAGVKIAIVDTGIGPHPDLSVQGGYNAITENSNYADDNGHGTHCAGIAAALDNGSGVIGVAPAASLYAVKVLDSSGSGWYSDIAAGIDWCIDNEIQVISMSLGGSTYSEALEDMCNTAYSNGIILVAAAGNSGNPPARGDTIEYPARYASVIAVAATDQNDSRAKWSSTGAAAELSAPGVSIYSTYVYNGVATYATASGTSMACPHVSGVAALVKFSDNSLTNVDVRERLKITADDLGATGWDSQYGYGLVDADEAAGVSAPPPPPPPPPSGEATAYLSIDVEPAYRTAGPNVFTYAVASITVLDDGDKPIAGATVSGQWSKLTSDSDSALTDAKGVAVIQSDAVKNVSSGIFTFSVESITKDGVSYNPDGETSDSLTL